jgi:response regulator of citrate/malate metabolism
MFLKRKDKMQTERLKSLLVLKRRLDERVIGLQELETDDTKQLRSEVNQVLLKVGELDSKIESMRQDMYEDFRSRSAKDSIRTSKMKKMIRMLLQEHGKLTSSQLSELINLSRTRCNEYLKEMETENEIKGTVVHRQKFYGLLK